jgi:flagellar biosynthesis protein FlhG
MIEGKRIIAVGGGKGGVGKSVVACNLAVGFAKNGANTVLVDADLGAPNLHTLLGIDHPRRSLGDLLDSSRMHLSDVLSETIVPNLRLACGAAPILGVANPEFQKKQRMLREIARLEADVLVVDIGAGVSYNVVDFFNAADVRVVVVTPQITSLHNAYGFIKSSLHRLLQRAIAGRAGYKEIFSGGGWSEEKIDKLLERVATFDPRYLNVFEPLIESFYVFLMGNMIEGEHEAKVLRAMRKMVRDFLCIECQVIGCLARSSIVQRSINTRRPFMLEGTLDANGERLMAAIKHLDGIDLTPSRKAVAQALASIGALPKSGAAVPGLTAQEALDEDTFLGAMVNRASSKPKSGTLSAA